MAEVVLKTFDVKKGKEVVAGIYDVDKKVYTREVANKHFMIKEQGYGIQQDVCETLLKMGCKVVKLVAGRATYSAPFNVWIKNAVKKDYGHGTQLFLNKRFYTEAVRGR